eukprot:3903764-Prymnesium_polylepis.1
MAAAVVAAARLRCGSAASSARARGRIPPRASRPCCGARCASRTTAATSYAARRSTRWRRGCAATQPPHSA